MRLADKDQQDRTTPTGTATRARDRRAGASRGRLLLALAAFSVVLWPAAPALAHNQLVSASPDRDAVLREAPTEVALAFLQRLDAASTTIEVTDAGKQAVPASAPAVKAKTAKVAFDQPLGNGEYTVAYSVVSVDGHPVKGKYTFTVADPAAAAPSPAATPPSAEAAPSAPATVAVASESDSGSGGVPVGALIGAGGLGVVVAAVAVYLYASRRRRAGA